MESKEISATVRRLFPTVGDLFAMLGIVLGVQVVVGLLLSVVAGFGGFDMQNAAPEAVGRYMCLLYLTTMSLGLLGAILYRRKRGGKGKLFPLSVARLNPVLLLWACVFLVAVSVVIEPLLSLLPNIQQDMGRGVWTLVMLVVFAPLFEEFICRGVVLGSMRAKYGVMTAWLGSSLFFGVLHLSPMLVVNAFVLGLILGYICLATDSIWASVLLHAFNNAIAYVILIFGDGERLLIDWIGNRTLYIVIYCVAAVVAVVSAYKMWMALRHMKEAEKPIVAEE